MAPEYNKVFIPPENAEQFEKIVKEFGGNYDSKKAARDETQVQQVWDQQATEARALVERFTNLPDDPNVVTGIDLGVTTLIHDVFHEYATTHPFYQETKIKGDINWNEVKDALGDIFKQSLPDEVPDNVYLAREGTALSQGAMGENRLLPRQILFILDSYGLHDGIGKRTTEVGRKYNVRRNIVSQNLASGAQHLLHNERLRNLVYEPHLII